MNPSHSVSLESGALPLFYFCSDRTNREVFRGQSLTTALLPGQSDSSFRAVLSFDGSLQMASSHLLVSAVRKRTFFRIQERVPSNSFFGHFYFWKFRLEHRIKQTRNEVFPQMVETSKERLTLQNGRVDPSCRFFERKQDGSIRRNFVKN